MKKRTYLIVLLILLILISAVLVGTYYFYKNPVRETITENINNKVYISNKTKPELEIEELAKIEKTSKDISTLQVSGWIPDYDIQNGIQTLKDQPIFSTVSPVWYYIQEDGSLKPTPYANGPELTSLVNSQGIKLIPTIGCFDQNVLSQILNNTNNFDNHIDSIVSVAIDNNYDGIDLDYEAIALADKDEFFSFLQKLSEKLKEKNKLLTFSVLPKWGNEIDYPLLPQTRRVEDYKKISDLVDELRIMAYNYRDRKSAEAGPIAPLKWTEYILRYAISEGVPREKIMLGVPTYSYDWTKRNLAPDDIDLEDWYQKMFSTNQLDEGSAYFNKQINQVRNGYDLTETFNLAWGEVVGTYTYKEVPRIIIFPNEESFKLKKQLAADFGIRGIIYWKLGGEDGLKLQ